MSASTPISSRQLSPTNELEGLILKPFEDGGAGEYLHYDPIYDQIRQARLEDDPRFTQGVWKKELKHIDPDTIINLCTQVLTQRSKDLQLLAWLCEAWLVSHRLDDFVRGLDLMLKFIVQFWDILHPTDFEHRTHLFEWMDEAFNLRLFMFPLSKSIHAARSYAYYDYTTARSLENALRRDPKSAARFLSDAGKRGEPTLAEFRTALSTTPIDFLKETDKHLFDIETKIHELKKVLDPKMGKDAPSFHIILSTVKDIRVLLKEALDKQLPKVVVAPETPKPIESPKESPKGPISEKEGASPSPPTSPPSMLPSPQQGQASMPNNDRREAYQKLRDLSHLFEKLEPQSPTAAILKTISTWENKSFIEILNLFGQGGDSLSLFLKLIGK